jgi:hypothetical protein
MRAHTPCKPERSYKHRSNPFFQHLGLVYDGSLSSRHAHRSSPNCLTRQKIIIYRHYEGLPASLVVLDHALGPIVEKGILPGWFDPVRFGIGGLGVTTFFVISGFIMISTSQDGFGDVSSWISFAGRRIVRIVPTYWVATFLAVILYATLPPSRRPSISELLKSLIFIPYSTKPDGGYATGSGARVDA